MAFFLRFDGANDYVRPNTIISLSEYRIVMELDGIDINTQVLLGPENSINSFIASRFTGQIRVSGSDAGAGNADHNFVSATINNNRITLDIDVKTTGTSVTVTDSFGVTETVTTGNLATGLDIGSLMWRGDISNATEGDLYNLEIYDATNTLIHKYDPSASNGTGQILPDTTGNNDGTLVNFPVDDSQWVFYDDGQGGVDTLIPTRIPSGEVVGTPSVTNLLKLIEPNTIPTEELVNTPTVDAGAVLISPATIPTGEVVYNVSVVDLTQFITAEDIPTQEVVGSPNLELLLSRIFPTAIATQENFETPLIIGGDRIAIPINDRATWNRVAAYLRTRKFSGNDNDVILAWLRSEGYIDTFNDAFNTYLEDVEALDGSLTDKYSNWRRQ